MVTINYFNKTEENTEIFEELGTMITNNAYKYMKLKGDKEISFIFLTNDEIQQMNKDYRSKDYPTDVLTFPSDDDYLGDIFISIDKVKEQAVEFNHSVETEMSFMFVHGFLHAIGYDHLTDDEHKEMFDLQDQILEVKR
ncbi:rRNA maturation RNase YbeY [Mycoplasmatota bacterium WC44]